MSVKLGHHDGLAGAAGAAGATCNERFKHFTVLIFRDNIVERFLTPQGLRIKISLIIDVVCGSGFNSHLLVGVALSPLSGCVGAESCP